MATIEQTATSLLAAGVRAADDERFEQLYLRIAPALFGWVTLQMGPGLRARVEPEEIVQETWLRAVASLASFDATRASFRAWLFGIARHVLLEAFKSLRRAPLVSNSTTQLFALANHPDSITSATRRVARDEGLRLFLERVHSLDEDDRVLVSCCGLEGSNYDDAAARLGTSRDAAKKRWQRLRVELASKELPADLLADFE